MKVSRLSLVASLVLAACGTESAQNSGNAPTKEQSKVQLAAQDATRPASMPKMVIVKVTEDGRGDVLAGKENVEVRTVDALTPELSADNIAAVFGQGQSTVVADNADDLNGESSAGQYYWRGYYGWGYGRAAYGWGHYGYSNWYRPNYWYGGYGYGYGYNNYYSWGSNRYYCYW